VDSAVDVRVGFGRLVCQLGFDQRTLLLGELVGEVIEFIGVVRDQTLGKQSEVARLLEQVCSSG
jgi:hypothetical protein